MYETNISKKATTKNGKPWVKVKVTGKRRSEEYDLFLLRLQSFKNANHHNFVQIRTQLLAWIKDGFVLRVDTWYAFEHKRIWTLDGQPQEIDADNRRKAMQDGLSKMLDIDDKWFFSGNVEKVSCNSKDLECSVIRILPVKARTLAEIRLIRNTAAF
jgi:hypothetical protein